MNRSITPYLNEWKLREKRKPLILRGARQVGKTHSVRHLGNSFEDFVEINLELRPDAAALFEKDLDVHRIVRDLNLLLGKEIKPGRTLLFLDEIQAFPRAITTLRYFYEEMPTLHVIAAGSLLDFAIQEVGVPVGRVSFLHMYPLSFIEFLEANRLSLLVNEIQTHEPQTPLSEPIHEKLLSLVLQYLAIGGMPEAVNTWVETQDPREVSRVHQTLIQSYRQDFHKYAKRHQMPYINLIYNQVPLQLGKKFKYSQIGNELRKRELAPCLGLLNTAGVLHQVFHTSAQGIPLGAETDLDRFKVIFLDVALSQALLGFDIKSWFLRPEINWINQGGIVEAFVGQELIAYSSPESTPQLYYWHREAKSSTAEVDYVIQNNSNIIPIEVKSGGGTTLKSMHLFLESHPRSPIGVRFSSQNYSVYDQIHSYPFYAIRKGSSGCSGS